MSAVPVGLGAANIRIVGPDEPELPPAATVAVDMDAPEGDVPELDERGNILKIEHGDGSVTVSLDGRPLQNAAVDKSKLKWFSNLVEAIDNDELDRISEDLLRAVDQDIESRREWIEDRAKGIKLLGLKVEQPNIQGAGTRRGHVEGSSPAAA